MNDSTDAALHPKAIEAQQRAEQAAQAARDRQQHTEMLAKHHALQFLHRGDFTVAYNSTNGDIVTFAVAIRNRRDRANPAFGEYTAATKYDVGHRTELRCKPKSVRRLFRALFTALSPEMAVRHVSSYP